MIELQVTNDATKELTNDMTIHREYERTHPWLSFNVDLRNAPASFWVTLGECQSKCEHLAGVPLRPDIAKILHQMYLAKGVWGTTSIEGNTLSEAEVLKHVEGKLEVPPSKEYLKQEVDNVIQECNRMLATIARRDPLVLSLDRIKEINRAVLSGLTLADNVVPGEIRHHSVGVMGYRGAPYQDCEYLFSRLCSWLNGSDFEPTAGLGVVHMAILKAVVAHLYVEWIHGFGDGNGRTGRLIEVQILLTAGVPSPACQLLSNHYNQTRNEYLSQLKVASASGGDVVPFITYALNGYVDGLRDQLTYVRKLQMDVAWINYVHDVFRDSKTSASRRQKALLLDIFDREEPVPISRIEQLSPRLAKEYAGMHPITPSRDVDTLEKKKLLLRKEEGVSANRALIAQFLPIKASVN
jgi:Fic family protein